MPDHAAKQRHTPSDVHKQVAVSREQRFPPAPEPDEEHGGKGHQLPEEEQGDEVACINAPDGPGDIEP